MAGEDLNVKLIEVDPQLFIKCRLCVINMGTYQIVPSVQQQIKYCFDINVEPYDGLPQLLCTLCKNLLEEYSENKTKFKRQQEALIAKLNTKEKNLSTLQQKSSEVIQNKTQAESELGDDSTNGDESNSNSRPSLILKISNINNKMKKGKMKTKSNSWIKRYHKRYICNFCSKSLKGKFAIVKHLNKHSRIRLKYNIIFDKLCTVKLNKVDEKLNDTGESSTVMFDRGKILQDVGRSLYHVVYLHPNRKQILNADKKIQETFERDYSDSSDDDNTPIQTKRKRFNRISSRSSSETVLIDDDNNSKNAACVSLKDDTQNQELSSNKNNSMSYNESDCINIVDSSDSDVEMTTKVNLKPMKKPTVNKIYDKIISVCKMKYVKTLEPSQIENKPTNTAQLQSQLKHKLLSIGRKVLSKGRSCNCTGLLRYMEHTNLDVSWLPPSLKTIRKEGLVHITILKNINSNESNNDASDWKDLSDITILPINEVVKENSSNINNDVNDCKIINKITRGLVIETPFTANTPVFYVSGNQTISHTATTDNEICKKLLNESPVANPKQLPKKINVNEIIKINGNQGVKNKTVFIDLQKDSNITNEDPNIFMPVITSTQSLAQHEEIQVDSKPITPEVTNKVNAEKPRIKVKPASELMKPENVLQNKDNHNNIWTVCPPQNTSSNIGTYFIQGLVVSNPANVLSNEQAANNAMIEKQTAFECVNNSTTDFLILDTVEFPNLKTNSPFNYLKNLLSIHNITLCEPLKNVPPFFDCLLKIKAHFKQDNKEKPIVLCLSIFCNNDTFFLCIKNPNDISIQMNKLSAVWQWEILKIFQGEVSKKVLQNALKSSSNNYNTTKKFLNLLKSIKCLLPLTLMNTVR